MILGHTLCLERNALNFLFTTKISTDCHFIKTDLFEALVGRQEFRLWIGSMDTASVTREL